MDTKLAQWINTELEKRGWPQRELARRAGVSHSAVSRALSGDMNAGWDFCAGVAKAFGVSPIAVFRRADLLPPAPPNADLELTADELDIILALRELHPSHREFVQDMLQGVVVHQRQKR